MVPSVGEAGGDGDVVILLVGICGLRVGAPLTCYSDVTQMLLRERITLVTTTGVRFSWAVSCKCFRRLHRLRALLSTSTRFILAPLSF
eukprot:4665881-Pyramimonas_sp.AAC.1